MALFYITNQESLAVTLFLLSFLRRKKLRREDSRPKNSYPQPKNNGCELSLDYGVRIFNFKITLITYQFRSAVFVLQLR